MVQAWFKHDSSMIQAWFKHGSSMVQPVVCWARNQPVCTGASLARCSRWQKGGLVLAMHTPQQIVVYPGRAKLIRYALTYLVAAPILWPLAIVWLRAVLSPDSPVASPILILGVLAGVLALLLTLL
jgi:hypothetical protein